MPKRVRERMAAATRLFESNPVLQGYKDAPDTVRGQAEAVSGRVREQPLIALLIAAGVGYILGRFIR